MRELLKMVGASFFLMVLMLVLLVFLGFFLGIGFWIARQIIVYYSTIALLGV